MAKRKRPLLFLLASTACILFLFLLMQVVELYHFQDYIDVLFPKGIIGVEQRNLLLLIQVLMLFIVIPVYVFTFIFSWKYRADNKNATYDPDLVDNWIAECFWWGIPLVMTLIVGGITWVKTFELDPYKPIVSENKALKVQAVALQWKWLFIYPDEQIAAVNFLQIPVNTPIHFEVTADAPMNSLWIPKLGGQIYAMPAMQTELNLIANEIGSFRGSSANISGEGFSGMHFITEATTEDKYKKWVEEVKNSPQQLSWESYPELALPSQNDKIKLYQVKDDNLFQKIMMKYKMPL